MVSRGLGIEELANLHGAVAPVALANYLGKRVPLHALVENLHGGANIREFVYWFPGATIEQIHAVLKLETNILMEFASQHARS